MAELRARNRVEIAIWAYETGRLGRGASERPYRSGPRISGE